MIPDGQPVSSGDRNHHHEPVASNAILLPCGNFFKTLSTVTASLANRSYEAALGFPDFAIDRIIVSRLPFSKGEISKSLFAKGDLEGFLLRLSTTFTKPREKDTGALRP
jgi:hypothetical protein